MGSAKQARQKPQTLTAASRPTLITRPSQTGTLSCLYAFHIPTAIVSITPLRTSLRLRQLPGPSISTLPGTTPLSPHLLFIRQTTRGCSTLLTPGRSKATSNLFMTSPTFLFPPLASGLTRVFRARPESPIVSAALSWPSRLLCQTRPTLLTSFHRWGLPPRTSSREPLYLWHSP